MPVPLPERTWGVLVYIVGDHQGLSPDEAAEIDRVATEEAQKLVRAARGIDDAYVSVHLDLTSEKGSRVYRVPGSRQPERRDEDRAGLASLVTFLEAEKTARPTRHKMVILWGHSGGPIGLFQDPDGGSGSGTLHLSELGKILPAFQTSPQAPIDILLVKSCYLATLEAAWEVEGLVDYMICSQARVPMRTWTIWEDVFEQITRDKQPKALADDILNALDRHYSDVLERNNRDEIPFSVLRPRAVTHLLPHLAALLECLLSRPENAAINLAIEDARPTSSGDQALIDVRRLCSNLINIRDPELSALAAALDEAIVPAFVVRNTPEISRFGGVGVFHFPRNPLLRAESFANVITHDVYRKLAFARRVPWSRLAFPPLACDGEPSDGGAAAPVAV